MIKEFLKKIGIDDATIAGLTAEETPEGFTLDEVVAKYETTQKEIFFAKHKKEIEDNIKKQEGKASKLAVTNSVKQKLKSSFGLDLDKNIKDAELDEVIAALEEKVLQSSQSNDDELKARLSDMTKKYGSLQEEIIGYKNKVKEKEQAFESFKVEYDTKFKVGQIIESGLNGIDWADNGDLLMWQRENLKNQYNTKYSIDADGVPTSKDGTPVLRPNNGGVYKHIHEIINDDVDRLKLRKLSNGGDRRDPSVVVQNVNGKNVDRSASAKLARELGFE